MRLIGEMAHLEPVEVQLSGLESPLDAANFLGAAATVFALCDGLQERLGQLAADYDPDAALEQRQTVHDQAILLRLARGLATLGVARLGDEVERQLRGPGRAA